MTVLIAFNGLPKSGKNTAANFVRKWGESRGLIVGENAFARAVKLSMARSLGMATNYNDAVVLIDELKDTGDINISIPSLSIMQTISGREFIKWFATEGHRDVFGFDFWVDFLLPSERMDWTENFLGQNGGELYLPDIALITDLRFANEARRVHELQGVVWEIDRGLQGDDHRSEQRLPDDLIDLTIENKDSLEALEVKMDTIMTQQYHDHFTKQEGLT